MFVIKYKKSEHKKIIQTCLQALKAGRVVAYPTDTSYGLAADATNLKALKKLYTIKERVFSKPIHVVIPSLVFARKVVRWNRQASVLARKFWPGPLTLVLELTSKSSGLRMVSAGTKTLGLRFPKNLVALDLAKSLGKPITATSANPSAHLSDGYDSYSAQDILSQFGKKCAQPDLVIDAGRLPKRKPSTLVQIKAGRVKILRPGPVSETQIFQALKK